MGTRFIPPEEHKAAEGSNRGLLLREVELQRQQSQILLQKRLQSQVGAREIPVGHMKKFSTVRIKYRNRVPRKAVKSPSLQIH